MNNDSDGQSSGTTTFSISNRDLVKRSTQHKATQQGQRRRILTEEQYESTLSGIIERDYFPSLPSLRRDLAVLDRRNAGDVAGAVAVRRAARRLQSHEEELTREEELEEREGRKSGSRKRPRPLHRETVTGFHARVTSEDNAEFEQKQLRELEERQEHLNSVFNQRLPPPENVNETPLMASDQFDAIPVDRKIESFPGKSHKRKAGGLFFSPQHVSASRREVIENKTVSNEPSNEENAKALMPPPASKPGTVLFTSSSSLAVKGSGMNQSTVLVEYRPKSVENSDIRIQPNETRFRTQGESNLIGAVAMAVMPSDAVLDYESDSTTTDLDATPLSLSYEREAREGRLQRERETYVAMTPLITPGANNASPIVTWGNVAATPLVVVGAEDATLPPSFELAEMSSQDRAAAKAEATLAKKKAERSCKTPSRKTTSNIASRLDRSRSLTPAARALLSKTSSRPNSPAHSVRSGGSFGSALRKSYTPLLSRKRASSSRSVVTTPRRADCSGTEKKHFDKGSRGNITDGLLNLPK